MSTASPKFKNRPNEQTKTADGRTVWLGRSVACVSQVIIYSKKQDKYFTVISQRGPAAMGSVGLYCFPCGYLDWDETTTECAIRETFEEVGVDLKAMMIDPSYSHFAYKYPILNHQPWHVNSMPNSNRQNVSCSHCFFFEVDGEFEFPTTTWANCEEGEVSDIKWVELKDVIHAKYTMAFNHDTLAMHLLSLIKSKQSGN